MLSGKTVLLLAPQFFGYEHEIQAELESLGAKVIYFDERPKNDFLTKALIRLNLKSFINRRINNYYLNILNCTREIELDYLFMVAPETIPVVYINKLRGLHEDLKIYTYFWDSIKNKKNALSYLGLSDKFYSFDSSDIKFDSKIEFLPLFYIKDYESIKNEESATLYDIAFIGTAHSDRYELIKKLEKQAVENNLKLFFYFYSPSRILFYFQKFFKREFKRFSSRDVSFKSLSKQEVLDIIKKSKTVIDIHHPLQNGLTMRSIEMLGAGKKILTTNSNVLKYDFYKESNIALLDREQPILNIDFCSDDYQKIQDEIYKKYSLKNWLVNIFTQ